MAAALADIGFDGTLSFETFPCMNSFPYGTRDEVLRTIHEVGVYIKGEIDVLSEQFVQNSVKNK